MRTMQTKCEITTNISRRASAWTLPMVFLMLTFNAGCMSAVSTSAICDHSAALRTDHAAALSQDGGPASQKTGAALIRSIDAGCADVDV